MREELEQYVRRDTYFQLLGREPIEDVVSQIVSNMYATGGNTTWELCSHYGRDNLIVEVRDVLERILANK